MCFGRVRVFRVDFISWRVSHLHLSRFNISQGVSRKLGLWALSTEVMALWRTTSGSDDDNRLKTLQIYESGLLCRQWPLSASKTFYWLQYLQTGSVFVCLQYQRKTFSYVIYICMCVYNKSGKHMRSWYYFIMKKKLPKPKWIRSLFLTVHRYN